MTKYAFNLKQEPFVFANAYEINASYRDLCAVCDSIRYLRADRAVEQLDRLIGMEAAIPYRRHNKYMGSRHELGGAKGRYPMKAAGEVKNVLVNAISNSNSRGLAGDELFVIHASANKTHIESRRPSKGSLSWGRGRYGMSSSTHSDLEYAKVEIGLGTGEEEELTKNMKYFIKVRNRKAAAPKKEAEKKGAAKKEAARKPPAKKEEPAKPAAKEQQKPQEKAANPAPPTEKAPT